MENTRFDEIKGHLTESVIMQLEQIRRFLNSGCASVMIGAGFSKNAIQPDSVKMKDWNTLARDFFVRLYNRMPTPEELAFKTPLRLASQVEASFGRNELDQLILDSLPDEVIAPSQLHVDLLKLNWKDVFTTNYDTLLERASKSSERPYSIVTTKETLLYERQPRIIKLHGSFKDIRPFIITEEDFRTYANKNPAFVNTVRQALIESLFCLIGFSGDDPNFLNWIGWLRDVMDKSIAPIYVIDFRTNLHESEIRLMRERGIKIINMHDFFGVSTFQEGLEFIFQYLSQQTTKWEFCVEIPKIKTLNDIKNLINTFKGIRTSYPGWMFPSIELLSKYDGREKNFPFKEIKENPELDKKTWLEILYEYNWRKDIFLDPKRQTNFIDYLKEIKLKDTDYDWQDSEHAVELKLALLRYYRENVEDQNFKELALELDGMIDSLTGAQKRLYYYNLCLMSLSVMDYSETGSILEKWHTTSENYLGCLWKSMIYMVIDRKSDAINLLNDSLQKLRTVMLSRCYEGCYLRSIKTAMENLLNLFMVHWNPIPTPEKMIESELLIQGLKQEYLTRKDGGAVTKNHHFGISSITTTLHLGGGYYPSYITSYRYFRLLEITGTPVGLSDFILFTEDKKLFIKAIKDYAPLYALRLIVRSNNEEVEKYCLDRKFMSCFTIEESNELFDYFIPMVKNYASLPLVAQKKRCKRILIPLLARVCTKVSQDRIQVMFEFLKDLHLHAPRDFSRELYNIVLDSLNIDNLVKAQTEILELPLLSNHWSDQISLTGNYAFKCMDCTQHMLDTVAEALKSPDKDANFLDVIYERICDIHATRVTEEQREQLNQFVHTWRNLSEDYLNVRYSFRVTPYDKQADKQVPGKLVNFDFNQLLKLDISLLDNSAIISSYTKYMTALSIHAELLTDEQHTAIIEKFLTFIRTHVDKLIKDDSKGTIFSYRKVLYKLWKGMTLYLREAELTNISIQLLGELYMRIKEYGSVGYPHLHIRSLLLRYHPFDKKKEFSLEINRNLVQIQENKQTWDAFNAMQELSNQKFNIQSMIGRIISLIEFTKSEDVKNSINQLYQLVIKDQPFSKSIIRRLYTMIENLYYNIPLYNIQEEVKTDIKYYSMRLAAAIEIHYGPSEGTNLWETLSNDENEYNDVKVGYQRGLKGF